MNGYWEGRRIFITGGSAGLGRALAVEAAARGARVAVAARGATRLAGLPAGIHRFVADLKDKEAIHPLAGEVVAALGGIDVVVNNASALGPTPLRLLLDTECEDLEEVLATNVLGPHRLTRALLPGMVLQGSGLVVNISSDAAVSAYPRWGAYGASKAALDHLSRILAEELAGTGVRVLALDPGDMDTEMHRAAIPDADPSQLARPEDVARGMLALWARAEGLGGVRMSASEWRALL